MLPSPRRVTEYAGTVFGIGGLLLFGLISGAHLLPVTVEVVLYEGVLSVAGFTLFVLATGGFVLWGAWGGDRTAGITVGPEACAIVPAYNDAGVIEGCVESLLASEYAATTVALVVEPDDPETRRAAEDLADRHEVVRCLENGEPGSKATAINHAVETVDADYFAVFDADEHVSPGFIPVAMSELMGGVDVFQGRRIPRPTGVVETLAYCERIVVQTGYAFGELFGFTHCQSSSTVFTRRAFEEVGGYDDRLTEDIDFSHKCYRAGLNVIRKRDAANTMEAPHTLRDLWCQRKRWRIGHVEVVDARIREAMSDELGPDDALSIGRAAGALGAGALLLVFAAHVAALVAQGFASAFLVPYLAVLGVVGGVWLRDYRDDRVGRPTAAVALVPLVYVGHGALTVKALLEYYLTWEGEWYQVTKVGS